MPLIPSLAILIVGLAIGAIVAVLIANRFRAAEIAHALASAATHAAGREAQFTSQLQVAEQRRADLEAQLSAQNIILVEREQALSEARGTVSSAAVSEAALRANLSAAEDRRMAGTDAARLLQQTIIDRETDIQTLRESLVRAAADAANAAAREAELRAHVDAAEQRRQDLLAHGQLLQISLGQRDEDIKALRNVITVSNEDATVLAAREAELKAQLLSADARRVELDAQIAMLERVGSEKEQDLRVARQEITRRKTEETTFETRLEEMSRAHAALKDSFQSLSGEALKNNNEQFLQLARTELERVRTSAQVELAEKEQSIHGLITPIREGLEKYDRKLQEIELARAESVTKLTSHMELMRSASESLRGETANLAKSLRSSNVRGAWGELQLKRVVELAGMLEHCDFETQRSVESDEGMQRPDMIIRLPGDRSIVVDAKTPATAVLEAFDSPDAATRRQLCEQHVASIRAHVATLNRKEYWKQLARAPEFTVLFLPSEAFFSVAMESDHMLFEYAFEQNVIITTPTTLIALLKAVAFSWRQEAITQNAQEISALGKQLYHRICTLGAHFGSVGQHLAKSVVAYNAAVNSMEKRVLPSARKFQTLGAADSKIIEPLDVVDVNPIVLNALDMRLVLPGDGEEMFERQAS